MDYMFITISKEYGQEEFKMENLTWEEAQAAVKDLIDECDEIDEVIVSNIH